MRKVVLLLLVVAGLLVRPAVAHAQKLVYVFRHAERADEPARNQNDPGLSAAGLARANRLAAMLGESGARAIFVTAFRRTTETAQPLATKLKIKLDVMPMSVNVFTSDLKNRHANDIVVVVAHSSTIPGLIKGLGGSDVRVDDSDYESFFVVVPATGTVSRLKF